MNKFMFNDVKFVAFGKLFIYEVELHTRKIIFKTNCSDEDSIDRMYDWAMVNFFRDDANDLLDIIDDLTGKNYTISYITYEGIVGDMLFIVLKLEEDVDSNE